MVTTAFRAALTGLREYFAGLGEQSPIQSLSLDDGGVVFAVHSDAGEVVANINICWTEAENYPNSGCLLFGHDDVSALSKRFQDRGELAEVVSEVLQVLLARDYSLPRTGRDASAAMDEDEKEGKPEGDDSMEEGSDGDWGKVASGSEDDNDEFGGGDDEEQQAEEEDEEEDGDDDEEERDLIILCSMNLGRWERHEAAVDAGEAAAANKQPLSSSQDVAAKRQIFNRREAFTMLSRELLDFLRGRHVDCSVETGGDDIYHWIVDLGSFAEGSALAKDMREVSRRYVYSTVRLRLRFMRGLHPFFPPSVEVVWPHLAGPLLGAVASHPMLKLENWDPWKPAMDTVAQIKGFLEANARVDLDNPVNDIRRHPQSTYSPLERGLARLEALSGVPPTCLAQPEIAALYTARDSFDKDAARLQALAEAGKKRGRSEPNAQSKASREVVWARGTGYGSGTKSGELWDAKATEAAQRARDAEIESLLDEMSRSLRRELGSLDLAEIEGAKNKSGETNAEESQAAENAYAIDEAGSGTEASGAGSRAGLASAPKPAVGKVAEEAAGRSSGAGGVGADAAVAAGGPAEMEGVETAAEAALEAMAGTAEGVRATSGGGDLEDMEPRLGPAGCTAALQASCLLPFLVRELHLASFSDMGARYKYYTALLALVRELCRPTTSELLWWEQSEAASAGPTAGSAGYAAAAAAAPAGPSSAGSRSVAGILRSGLRSAARIYLNFVTQATTQSSKAAATTSQTTAPPAIMATRPQDKVAQAQELAAKEAEAMQNLARIILQVCNYLEATCPPIQQLQEGGAGARMGVRPSDQKLAGSRPPGVAVDAEKTGRAPAASEERAASGSGVGPSGSGGSSSVYLSALKELQMDAVSNLSRSHHYANSARGELHAPRVRAVRLAKEIASLESLLPLSESSSVFVRVDEGAIQLWKTMIVGPEDTPYSGGCFVFDFYFPPQYPATPPQVHMLTTGGGRVRFNPNLYAEGKVCLSLLGTWSGDKGESWNADVSTAVQVLISIQSLIMVPEPYFNEPSYESQTGDHGKKASREYNKTVRENCVRYAMLDILRHPPTAFAKVIQAHFQLRRDALLTQIKTWADEAREWGDPAAASRLLEMRRDLEALIAAGGQTASGGAGL